jgi:hypothetical protein
MLGRMIEGICELGDRTLGRKIIRLRAELQNEKIQDLCSSQQLATVVNKSSGRRKVWGKTHANVWSATIKRTEDTVNEKTILTP